MSESYGEPVMVPRGSLTDISDVLADDMAVFCIRDIDEDHLESLRAVGVEHLPPLKVANLDGRQIVVGGYHRLRLWAEKKAAQVPVQIRQAQSLADVAMLAYEDNAAHGKPWNKGTKTAYAVWLYQQTASMGKTPNLSEIARLAGINKSVLSRALKRERSEASATVDGVGSGKAVAEYLSAADKVLRDLATFYSTEGRGFNLSPAKAEHIPVRAKALARAAWDSDADAQTPIRLRSLGASLTQAADILEQWQTHQAATA